MLRVIRFGRREPWLALAIIVTVTAACVLCSIAVLEMFGIVRVFGVTHSADGSISSVRQIGIESPSHALSIAQHNALLVLVVAVVVSALRLARRTAGYRIGGWRTIGLFMPPCTLGVVAGALHAATNGVVRDEHRDRVHWLITIWCWTTFATLVLNAFSSPSWSSIEPVATLGRGWSMALGALVAGVTAGAVAVILGLTATWLRLTPAAARKLERRLAELPTR